MAIAPVLGWIADSFGTLAELDFPLVPLIS